MADTYLAGQPVEDLLYRTATVHKMAFSWGYSDSNQAGALIMGGCLLCTKYSGKIKFRPRYYYN